MKVIVTAQSGVQTTTNCVSQSCIVAVDDRRGRHTHQALPVFWRCRSGIVITGVAAVRGFLFPAVPYGCCIDPAKALSRWSR